MKSPTQIGIVLILVLIAVVTLKLKSIGEPHFLPYMSHHSFSDESESLAKKQYLTQTDHSK
ncbi:hypothetical protein ACVFI8_12780 [Agarivorans sp. MS3-6]